jgi:hypothetical protein
VYIPVYSREITAVLQPFDIRPDFLPESLNVFRRRLFSYFFYVLAGVPAYLSCNPSQSFFRADDFPGGYKSGCIKPFHRTLGEYIENPQGIYFFVKQFNTHRMLFIYRKHIHNSASDRELPGPLNCHKSLIAHFDQFP